MAFKSLIIKLRQTLLCCHKHERKPSLDIGSPTNVRRVDISDALPGLTDAERKYIREKASSDAVHLLSLHSLPSSHPPTSPPSPTSSLAPVSVLSSREPSDALLNAASKDLPSTLPTPPRRTHNENSPPATRMKSMWSSVRDEADSASLYSDALDGVAGLQEKGMSESFMTLNLEFDFEDKKDRADSPRTLSLAEGFEMQDTTGGATPVKQNLRIEQAVRATALGDSSDSEEDTFVSRETKPLVSF